MELTIELDLQKGIEAHNSGNLQEAERVYQAILRSHPKHPDASHNLGLIAISVNQIEAALPLFKTALDVNPMIEQFWISYIDALIKNNQLKGAKQAIKKAKKKGFDAKKLKALLSQSTVTANNEGPSQEQLNSLFEYYQNGQFSDAEKLAVTITQKYPTHPFSWKVLGAILEKTGRNSEALPANQTAVALSPQDAEAHYNLGNTLHELGRLDDAVARYTQAIALKPDYAEPHYNLGITQQELGRLKEAAASYTQAIALKPDYAEAHSNLGLILNALGSTKSALRHFETSLQLTRGTNDLNLHHKSFRYIKKAKIDHDIEQFEYLAGSGHEMKRFDELATLYKTVSSEINCALDTDILPISDKHLNLLGDTYNRSIHILEAPALIETPIGGGLDANKITEDYLEHEFGLTYIDNFLSPTALKSLRDFLLGSTIWFDFFHTGGYMGAILSEGLASPLILQVAEDLRKKFPKIFKDHRLTQLWAYKYDSRACEKNNSFTGIRAHADFAAINVNFWITPQSANLDPSSGGLIVYNAEAPLEWDFKTYNNDVEKIREEILKSNQKKTVVPYNENRAVIFNSNLFHETDKIEFREGYENRRINVTMLFGTRGL
jgi:tetratricopeptide (TPR) repeat protein